MIDEDILRALRRNLQPQGTAPIVFLRHRHSWGIELPADFVNKCIDEMERIVCLQPINGPPSNLEKLAFYLLLDSAHIDSSKENR
jgi:hypothetical protein